MAKKYDIRIKEQVTQEICVEKKSTSYVASRYDIPLKTVEKWVTQFNKNPKALDMAAISEQEKIKKLEREVKELRKENEILKKVQLLLGRKE